MVTAEGLSPAPAHTIQTVSEMTGIPAVTLRMWERRYGVVAPARSTGNYRLYSDREVALLRWLKHEVDGGIPVRVAAAELRQRLAEGNWPEALPALRRAARVGGPSARAARQLFDALVSADERRARALLQRAHSLYDLDTICLGILTPCLMEIGEAWHRGEIRIAQEHHASSFLRAHLLSLYQAYPLRRGAFRAFVGCAPSEQHEIGALMVALFLRRGGCRVDYLGANLDLSDLLTYARDQRPDLIALSATTEGPALALERTAALLEQTPAKLLAVGGRAFNLNPDLRKQVRGTFLGEDAAKGAAAALRILRRSPPADPAGLSRPHPER